MSFVEKIKHPQFWANFTKVAVPFFIIVVVISLFINSFSEIFSGDFETLYQRNFSDGKWKNFFGFKIVFSVFYGLYITYKKM
jgi:hypothetical protein